ncbi:MAG: hypothetical protein AAF152_05115 [Cyanobacteria bacterium P01_A01_bin.114]
MNNSKQTSRKPVTDSAGSNQTNSQSTSKNNSNPTPSTETDQDSTWEVLMRPA